MSQITSFHKLLGKSVGKLSSYGRPLFRPLREKKYLRGFRSYSGRIPAFDGSYESLAALAYFLLQPFVKGFAEKNEAIVNQLQSVGDKKLDMAEVFCRSFIGAAYLISSEYKNGHAGSQHLADLLQSYRSGLLNGIDPASDMYWGNSRHLLIENSSLIIGLFLTEKILWDNFESKEKQLIADYFRGFLDTPPYHNNWLWFKVFHHLFFEKFFCEDHSKEIERYLAAIEEMYLGGGWYNDGVLKGEMNVDYYAAWGMQYYSLLFVLFAQERYKNCKTKYLSRGIEFIKSYKYYFTPGNINVPFGRSQLYRFASLSPIGLLLYLSEDFSEDLEWLKTCFSDTLNNYLKSGALDDSRFLTMGLLGPKPAVVEHYSGGGSPYWAMKAFSFLLIPKGHRFWQSECKANKLEGVYTIRPAKHVLLHDGHSEIKLLNGGSRSILYPARYNKFAYSNIFFSDYNDKKPFADNTMLLRTRFGLKWYGFGKTIQSQCEEGICSFEWKPEKLDNVRIKTVLFGFPAGYFFFHEIRSDRLLWLKLGGFILPDEANAVVTEQSDSLRIKDRKNQKSCGLTIGPSDVGLRVFKVKCSNKTPLKREGTCPVFIGQLSSGTYPGLVTGWIWTSQTADNINRPTLHFNNGGVRIMGKEVKNITKGLDLSRFNGKYW